MNTSLLLYSLVNFVKRVSSFTLNDLAYLYSDYSNKYLSVPSDNYATKVMLSDMPLTALLFTPGGRGGTVKIRDLTNSRPFMVFDKRASQNDLIIWKNHRGANQEFLFDRQRHNLFKIICMHKCLTVTDRGDLVFNECSNTQKQSFRLLRSGKPMGSATMVKQSKSIFNTDSKEDVVNRQKILDTNSIAPAEVKMQVLSEEDKAREMLFGGAPKDRTDVTINIADFEGNKLLGDKVKNLRSLNGIKKLILEDVDGVVQKIDVPITETPRSREAKDLKSKSQVLKTIKDAVTKPSMVTPGADGVILRREVIDPDAERERHRRKRKRKHKDGRSRGESKPFDYPFEGMTPADVDIDGISVRDRALLDAVNAQATRQDYIRTSNPEDRAKIDREIEDNLLIHDMKYHAREPQLFEGESIIVA